MEELKNIIIVFFGLVTLMSCQENYEQKSDDLNFETEKSEILECLNNETKSAFARDYTLWTTHWIHEPDIFKTYINFVDSTSSESIGWDDISGFVKKFIEEHPEPEPAPKLVNDISVRLYQDGAWVSYQQIDSLRGVKRETRLMEKVNDKWKIAGMHTTIYGFNED